MQAAFWHRVIEQGQFTNVQEPGLLWSLTLLVYSYACDCTVVSIKGEGDSEEILLEAY